LALKSFMHFRHQGAPVLILANLVFYHSWTTLYVPFVVYQKYIKQPEWTQKAKITIFVPVYNFIWTISNIFTHYHIPSPTCLLHYVKSVQIKML
jgi:hypothetical protein